MTLATLSRTEAIIGGGLAAGLLDLITMFVIWPIFEHVPALVILQAMATALMGNDAYQADMHSALLGLMLHFLVSLGFAAAYVAVADRISFLKTYPFICGPIYGIIAYLVMTYIVVPLSLATFGRPDSLFDLARSVLIHMFVFAPPIALAASRVRD